MLYEPHRTPLLGSTAALVMGILLVVAPPARQGVSKVSPNSASQSAAFFPPGAVDGYADFFSQYLSYFNEPSLLAAAQNSSSLSYRLESIAAQKSQILAIRLSVSSDGSARVFTVQQSGTPSVLHRTEHCVPAGEVKKFLELIDKSDFWSMREIR